MLTLKTNKMELRGVQTQTSKRAILIILCIVRTLNQFNLSNSSAKISMLCHKV